MRLIENECSRGNTLETKKDIGVYRLEFMILSRLRGLSESCIAVAQ